MTISKILDQFRPGRTIYLPGATGEIRALANALADEPERMDGVTAMSCLLPGMNNFDYAALHDNARLTTFLFPPSARDSFDKGKLRVLPMSYFGISGYMQTAADLDVAVVHVAPALPREGRMASVGIAADFTSTAWQAARTRIAFVNPAMPAMPRGPRIDLDEADFIVEAESPLIQVPPTQPDAVGNAIAVFAAGLVEDGSALQVGIGSAPAALWRKLASHRELRLQSGLANGDLLLLADSDALAADGHVAGILAGTNAFYSDIAVRDLLRLAETRETHDARALGSVDKFVAANSALEVDLFGQVNLEWQVGKPVSGVGGALDFAAAALASPGGCGIIMLPATARRGTISRIVPRLGALSVSLPRNLADVIVTEHGIARLRHASIDERAESLIAIAAPEFRRDLAGQWQVIRSAM